MPTSVELLRASRAHNPPSRVLSLIPRHRLHGARVHFINARRIAKELGVHVRTGGRSRKLLLAGGAKIVFGMPRLIVDLDLVEAALYTAPHVSNMRASEGLVR